MQADRDQLAGDAFSDAFSDAFGDAFCDALRPHHPASANRLQIGLSRACEKVRQLGICGICSSAFAGGPLCGRSCDPICSPSGTDHSFLSKCQQIRTFRRAEKIRQRGVPRGSRRARGVSCAADGGGRAQACCTSAGSIGAFLSWNGSASPHQPQGAVRAAAQTHVRAARRRLRRSSSGRWSS